MTTVSSSSSSSHSTGSTSLIHTVRPCSKEDYVSFRLAKKEDGALHFGGLSFYRRSDDSIDGYIVMRNGENTTEHHLDYKRR